MVAALVTAALTYTWRYFDEVESYFHALFLLFLTGMVGFALTGDLFNAFVFFELMGAVAYVLTGYKVEEAKPLQGALNFAVINSLGAYCSLLGIGLIYGRRSRAGFGWAGVLFIGVSALTGGAVLRAGLRIFLGVGTPPKVQNGARGTDEHRETDQDVGSPSVTMLGPVVVLLAGGLTLGLFPGLAEHADQAAHQLLDSAGYAAAALDGIVTVPSPPAQVESWSPSGLLLGVLSALLAMLVAAVALYLDRLPSLLRKAAGVLTPPLRGQRAAHSGHLGDYVICLLLGATLLIIGLAAA